MQEVILNMMPLKDEERAAFQAAAPDAVHIYAHSSTVTPEELSRATILFGWPRPESFQYAKNLKWFHCMFAGVERYLPVLPPETAVTNSSGANALSVAENMLSTLMALYRKLPQYRDNQRAHRWHNEGTVRSITGAVILVVGAGHLGTEFAWRCKALGAAKVMGVKRSVGSPLPGFDELHTLEELDDLLPQADVVSLTLPHSPETVHLMDAGRIARMKDDAVLISSGRGSVLDQDALAQAMKNGKLWGAALDVTEPEPLPGDSPLWDIPNLLLTPHAAGGISLEITRKNCVDMALANLKRYLAGEPLENRVKR